MYTTSSNSIRSPSSSTARRASSSCGDRYQREMLPEEEELPLEAMRGVQDN